MARGGKSLPQKAGLGGGGLSNQLSGSVASAADETTGTSIFDPVLCELAYRWFCPPGGMIYDPFAGGSVRGIVASKLGRQYLGFELRPEQVAANRAQADDLCKFDPSPPAWVEGDSDDTIEAYDEECDFIFTCPPYADLEIYSDLPDDISNMPYPKFRQIYSSIIGKFCERLRPNRFACVVVGDARGKDGCYYGLPWHTVEAFQSAGLKLYNEAVLVTSVGSLPIRARAGFEKSRKLGKTHQNVFVFVKGDPIKATAAVGQVDFGDGEDDPLAADA